MRFRAWVLTLPPVTTPGSICLSPVTGGHTLHQHWEDSRFTFSEKLQRIPPTCKIPKKSPFGEGVSLPFPPFLCASGWHCDPEQEAPGGDSHRDRRAALSGSAPMAPAQSPWSPCMHHWVQCDHAPTVSAGCLSSSSEIQEISVEHVCSPGRTSGSLEAQPGSCPLPGDPSCSPKAADLEWWHLQVRVVCGGTVALTGSFETRGQTEVLAPKPQHLPSPYRCSSQPGHRRA